MPDYHFGPLFRFIEDAAIYMESGYLELLSVAPCNINTPRPAVLHYSAATSAYVNAKTTPLQGKIFLSIDETLDEFPFTGQALENGSRSKAIGCPDSVKSLTYTDACDTTYTIPEEELTLNGFCPIDNILRKKKAQAFVPSSMFSGKLRLMIQAIYGSKRNDYSVIEVDDLILPGKLSIGGFTVSALYQPSYGLFTTADYEYFLVEVTSQVSYYPLILSAVALQFVEILKTHPRNNEPDFVKKIEAYILSTATIDEANVITGGALDIVDGSVLYYGWHWKWDGSEADIVIHSVNNTNLWYDTTRYHLEITYTDGVFSEQLSVVSSGHWWPTPLGLNIFVPFPEEGKQVVILPIIEDENGHQVSALGPVGSHSNTDIYVYRSMSDELITYTYNHNMYLAGSDYSFDATTWCIGEGESLTEEIKTLTGLLQGGNNLTVSNSGGVIKQIAGSYTSQGFYLSRTYVADGIGTELYRFKWDSGSFNLQSRLGKLLCDGSSTIENWLLSTGLFIPHVFWEVQALHGEEVAFWRVVSHESRETYTFREQYNTPIFLQIPYLDCSTLIIGNRERDATTGLQTGQNSTVEHSVEAFVSIMASPANGGGLLVGPVSLQGSADAGTGDTILSPISNPTGHTGTADLVIYEQDGDTSINIYTGGSLPEYFDILYFLYPFVDHLDWVVEDTSGGYKFSYKAIPVDDAKYPGNSAIGWV